MSKEKIHDRNWIENLLVTYGDGFVVAPFYFILSKLASKSTDEVKYGWMQETDPGSGPIAVEENHNYHQIFRKRVLRFEDYRDQAYSLRKKVIEMARDFEAAYLWGHRQEIESSGHVFHSMGGLAFFSPPEDVEEPFIIDNEINVEIIKRTYKASTFGRYIFVSPHMFEALDALEIIPQDKTWGIPMKQVRSSLAVVNVVADPILLDRRFDSPTSQESYWQVFLVEFNNLTRMYLMERDWKAFEMEEYPLMTSLDGEFAARNPYKYHLLAEQGLRVQNPSANLVLNLKGEKNG